MTRHEETINAANEYVTKTHSPSTNEFQTAMNIAVVKAYIVAAQWADKTMVEKACAFLFVKTKMSGSEIAAFRKAMEE